MKEGFQINLCDKCVANKIINEKQCTIAWHVDDNKLSHVGSKVVTEVIDLMKVHFGDLTITRGKAHTFLGINTLINNEKNIEIEMKEQLKEAVSSFEISEVESMTESVTSPVARHLRETNDECEKVTTIKSESFHSIAAEILHIMKRARPDL